MGLPMWVCGHMTGRTDMGWRPGQTPVCMKVISRVARRKDLVCSDFLMGHSTKENIKTTISMDRDFTHGQMVDSMSDSGSIIKCRARVLLPGVMGENMWAVMKLI